MVKITNIYKIIESLTAMNVIKREKDFKKKKCYVSVFAFRLLIKFESAFLLCQSRRFPIMG